MAVQLVHRHELFSEALCLPRPEQEFPKEFPDGDSVLQEGGGQGRGDDLRGSARRYGRTPEGVFGPCQTGCIHSSNHRTTLCHIKQNSVVCMKMVKLL